MNTIKNLFSENDIFFNGTDGEVGYIKKAGKDVYRIAFVQNAEDAFYHSDRSATQVIKFLKKHNHAQSRIDASNEIYFSVVEECFPWVRDYSLVVQECLGKYTLALLIFSIREGWNEMVDEICAKDLSEEKYRNQILTNTKGITIRTIKGQQIVIHSYQGKPYWSSYCGTGLYVESLSDNNRHYRISEDVRDYLLNEKARILSLREKALHGTERFAAAKFGAGSLAYRKLTDENPAKERYQIFMVMSNGDITYYSGSSFDFLVAGTSGILKTTIREAISDAAQVDFGFRKIYQCTRSDFGCLSERPQIISNDTSSESYLFLTLLMDYFCGLSTEDDCEELTKFGEGIYTVPGIIDIYPKKIEVLEYRANGPAFLHPWWSYSCTVKIDEKEVRTKWHPKKPGELNYIYYHHEEKCHLDPDQVEYMWKMTHARKDSTPLIGAPGNIEK